MPYYPQGKGAKAPYLQVITMPIITKSALPLLEGGYWIPLLPAVLNGAKTLISKDRAAYKQRHQRGLELLVKYNSAPALKWRLTVPFLSTAQ